MIILPAIFDWLMAWPWWLLLLIGATTITIAPCAGCCSYCSNLSDTLQALFSGLDPICPSFCFPIGGGFFIIGTAHLVDGPILVTRVDEFTWSFIIPNGFTYDKYAAISEGGDCEEFIGTFSEDVEVRIFCNNEIVEGTPGHMSADVRTVSNSFTLFIPINTFELGNPVAAFAGCGGSLTVTEV